MSEARRVIELNSIVGDDETDTRLLREMAEQAERYILSFEWCLRLKEGYFTDGFGGIIAIFLFRADVANLGNDRWTWVFVGDAPPAYLEMDHNYRDPQNALKRYIDGLAEWIAAVRAGHTLNGLIPINAASDSEALKDLARRVDTLREQILPYIKTTKFHPGTAFPQ